MASAEVNLGKFETGVNETSICFDWNIKSPDRISEFTHLPGQQHVEFNMTDENGANYTWRVSLNNVLYWGGALGVTNLIGCEKNLVRMSADRAVGAARDDGVVHSICVLTMPKLHSQWLDQSAIRTILYKAEIGPDELKVGQSSFAGLLTNDTFEIWPPREVTIHVQFTLYSSTKSSNNGAPVVEKLSMMDVSRLFGRIEGDAVTADVNILSKDGMSFPAHRFVLSGRSPVFQTMLQTTMKEVSSGDLECDDISGKCLKTLLHFFYTGKLAENWNDLDVLWELKYAAEKYQVKHLLELLDADAAGSLQSARCTEAQ